MVQFTYTFLKNAADHGTRVGGWKGTPVYAASKMELAKLNSDYCYILYDDDNCLYHDGSVVGQVMSNGGVMEYERPVRREVFPRKEEKRQYQEKREVEVEEEAPLCDYDLDEMLDRICDEVSKMLDEACLE